ncbi:YdcF family protein [Phenylobacterium sp.]|uniref:YdcF family protein n=1 Tax=Phenylobacterium sp. TaxID=1871053 RepID=UPI0025EF0EB5|nr:YdcF family protein [Phenylobacterium sp.]
MNAPPLIVIFGAVVRPDGAPSASLLRRIGYGLQAARSYPTAPVLCSGGVCRPGTPSEASIMAQVLVGEGVSEDRLVLDEESLSTLDNVEAAVRAVDAGGHPFVLACSDAYHLPRIRLLLSLHGVRCRTGTGLERAPMDHVLAMAVREAAAIPHNMARVMARRSRRTS